MGVKQEDFKNHEAINTIIMAVKMRICFKDRLKCFDANKISNIIDNRIRAEKYQEKKYGKKQQVNWISKYKELGLKNTLSGISFTMPRRGSADSVLLLCLGARLS